MKICEKKISRASEYIFYTFFFKQIYPNEIVNISDQIENVTSEIANVSDQIANVTSEIANVSDQIANITSEIANVSDQIANDISEVANIPITLSSAVYLTVSVKTQFCL